MEVAMSDIATATVSIAGDRHLRFIRVAENRETGKGFYGSNPQN